MWAYLNRKIAEEAPQSPEELMDVTIRCWKDIPLTVVNKFCNSFENKCRRTVAREKGKEVIVIAKKKGRPPGSKNKPKKA